MCKSVRWLLIGAILSILTLPEVGLCEEYDIFDLGADFNENGSGYVWSDVNDAGEVVGKYSDGSTEYPVTWKDEEVTRLTQTENTEASFIAEDGSVAGRTITANPGSISNPQNKFATLWHREDNAGYSEFVFPGLAGLFGTTRSLSNSGILAGDRYVAGSPSPEYEIFVARPPLYNPTTLFNEREFFSNTGIATIYPSRVFVNNEGLVAVSYFGASSPKTFIFKAGEFSSIDNLAPLALNDSGDILGEMQLSGSPDPVSVPVILNSDGTRTMLAPPNGFEARSTTALDMSLERVVVGVAQTESDTLPIIWRDGQPSEANALIPADSGWTYIIPLKISGSGNMIGSGILNGATRWFLLKKKEVCSASGLSTRIGTQAAAGCDLGVTWEMPGNESQQNAAWTTGDGVIPPNLVNPKTYTVVLIATNGNAKFRSCPADKFYKWTITPAFKLPPGRKQKKIVIGDSCREPIQIEDEGKYYVSVEERRKSDRTILRSAKKRK